LADVLQNPRSISAVVGAVVIGAIAMIGTEGLGKVARRWGHNDHDTHFGRREGLWTPWDDDNF